MITTQRALGAALAVLLAAGSLLIGAPPAEARSATSSHRQLATLGYLSYAAATAGQPSVVTKAVKSFQADRCLDVTGQLNARTTGQLTSMVAAVQGKLKVSRTGTGGAVTRAALRRWQRAHRLTATGQAGRTTMAKLRVARTRPCGSRVVGNVRAGSRTVPCARGTRNLGVHTGYSLGKKVRIRLCAIPGLRSPSGESTPGSAYYVKGARGSVVVNSRVSGAVLGLLRTANNSGRTLRATSSFRTMAHQKALCRASAACRSGNYRLVAKPGRSNHQLGAAVDFAGTGVTGGKTCGKRAQDRASGTWRYLNRNARRFGLRQYAPESWHWDALRGSDHC